MTTKNLKMTPYILISIFIFAFSATAQTTEFTYQGKLTVTGTQSATYDFEFRLCDSAAGDCSTPLATVQRLGVATSTTGVFTVRLDFGEMNFSGLNRWLEIAVRRPNEPTFVTLSPREPITSSPYSIKSKSSDTAANSGQLGGVNADQYVQTNNPALTDARNPLPNSANYLQNTTTPQTAAFNITGNGIVGSSLGVGTATPRSRFHVVGTSWFQGDTTPLPATAGSGIGVGFTGSTGYLFAFDYGTFTPRNLMLNHTGGNVGIGTTNPLATLHVERGGLAGAVVARFRHTTANGLAAVFDGRTELNGDTTITGVTNHFGPLFLQNGNVTFTENLSVFGTISTGLGTAGSSTLCRNSSGIIASCSSSLRYKTNFAAFNLGLNVINQLQPITFDWKDDGASDLGFGAEDVANINPLLVTYNNKGEVEGVKYDRLSVVFVNAFKEQQKQIDLLLDLVNKQQEQIESLKLSTRRDRQRIKVRANRNRRK